MIGGLVAVAVVAATVLAVVLVSDDDNDNTETTGTTRTTVEQGDGGSSGTSSTTGTTGSEQPITSARTAPEQSFVCPEGGMAAAEDLQRSVDEGHQPWRLSPEDVASSCAFGSIGAEVEAVRPDTYRVTDTATGQALTVDVTQPVRQGPAGIWAATSMTPID